MRIVGAPTTYTRSIHTTSGTFVVNAEVITMSGTTIQSITWNMNGQSAIMNYANASDLPSTTSVVTRARGDARYLQLTGGTITGNIFASGVIQVQNGGGQTATAIRFGAADMGFYGNGGSGTSTIYASVDGLQAAAISPAGAVIPLSRTVITKEKLDPLINGVWAKQTRAFETVYTNSENHPIEVAVYASTSSPSGVFTPSATTIRLQVSTNGSTWVDVLHGFLERTGTGGSYSRVISGTVTIPAGHRYRLTSGEASKVLYDWVERR
jgi:hypothetical protein